MNYVVSTIPPNHPEIKYTIVDAKNPKEAEDRFKDQAALDYPNLPLDGLKIICDYAS